MRLREYWRHFVKGLQRLWWPMTALGRALYVSRASIVALVFGGGLIAFTDQARDMVLASIAPDASFGSKLAVVGSVSFWAFSSWIWSRAALDAGFKMRRDLPGLASWQKGWLTILCNHVPRVIGAASIAAVALAFQSGYAAYRDAGATADAERYRDYAIGVSILAVIFYLVLAIRKYLAVCLDDRIEEEKRIEEKLQAAPKDREANDDKTKETKTWRRVHSALNGLEWSILIASLVAFGLCSYWFATNPVAAAAFFGNSINVVLVGLALLTPVLGAAVLLSERSRLPVFGAVVIMTALIPEMTHDHHDVRLCEPGGDKSRCADPGYPAPTRLDLREAFLKWWDYNAKPDMFAPLAKDLPDDWRTPPLVVVATAGGASRAAFWTSLVLGELAAREERFADRTFLISGVSGGSLGATLFRSLVEEDRLRHSGQGSPLLTSAPRDAERFIQRDFWARPSAPGCLSIFRLHQFHTSLPGESRVTGRQRSRSRGKRRGSPLPVPMEPASFNGTTASSRSSVRASAFGRSWLSTGHRSSKANGPLRRTPSFRFPTRANRKNPTSRPRCPSPRVATRSFGSSTPTFRSVPR